MFSSLYLYGGAAILIIVLMIISRIFKIIQYVRETIKSSKTVLAVPGLQPSHSVNGNIGDIVSSGSLHEFLLGLHSKFGPIASFWFGAQPIVSVASPPLFKESANSFDRPPTLFEMFEPIYTRDSNTVCNGREGRSRFATFLKSFNHDTLPNYMPVLQQVISELVSRWKELPSGDHIPLTETMFSLSIKALSKVALGQYMDNETISKMHQKYQFVFDELEKRLKSTNPEMGDEAKKTFNDSLSFIFDELKKVLRQRRETTSHDVDYRILDYIIDSGMTDSKQLADLVMVFVAGLHTTGLLMAWTVYYMSLHEEVQDKAYREIHTVLGDVDITYAVIIKLEYLRQVLDETLRVAVLAPYTARFQDHDTQLGGYTIPAEVPIIHALGVSFCDETIWPQPKKFDPERFSAENRKKIPNFGFEPFGFAGGRQCPGWRLSIVEAAVFFATALREFKFELVPGAQPVRFSYGLITKPTQEIWVIVTKRD